jgi:hypothetical protein
MTFKVDAGFSSRGFLTRGTFHGRQRFDLQYAYETRRGRRGRVRA